LAKRNDGLIDLLCILPWKVSAVLALVVYFSSHYLIPAIAFNNVFFKMLAPIAPLFGNIFSLVCVLCAVFSAANSFTKAQRLDSQKGHDSIRNLGWREFEELVGEAFRRKGFSVRENESRGPDGGVDLVLVAGTEKHLVQCKQWKALKVGVKVVRELYGVMAATGAVGGFVVTSGQFTREAQDFAQGTNIKLIGGPELWGMIQGVQASMPISTSEPAVGPTKQCQKCGKEMVVRTARQGQHVGQQFWGCKGYPACKSTTPL